MTKVFGNLFTNAIMLNLGKIYGNIMIDLNVSNYKLWFRALGIVKFYLQDHGIDDYSEEDIFSTTQQVLMEREETLKIGKFFPPVVRVANIMLRHQCDVKTALRQIATHPKAGSWLEEY